ncbi:MAG: SLATT domain-containing protein [Nitrospirales bacterium]|nr:SLATT domain-containing protein [Nitrospirales bacterium]
MTNHELSDTYLKDWLRSLQILHQGHWDAARFYGRLNLGLGVATTVTAAISGTTAFTNLAEQPLVGLFGVLAAGLAALQTSIRPSELSAQHKHAAVKYGQMRRHLEEHLDLGLPTEHTPREKLLREFREEWNAVDDESLPVPQRIYKKVKAMTDKKSSRS